MASLALASSEPPIVLHLAAERRERLARMRGESIFIPNSKFLDAWKMLDGEHVHSLRKINEAAAACYKITYNDLISARRQRAVVLSRALAIYVAKETTTASFPMLGRHLGKRDHTTVLKAYNRAREIYGSDPSFASKADRLIKIFKN